MLYGGRLFWMPGEVKDQDHAKIEKSRGVDNINSDWITHASDGLPARDLGIRSRRRKLKFNDILVLRKCIE